MSSKTIATFALLVLAASVRPASARSIITDTFAATLSSAIEVLETADGDALAGAAGGRIRTFASRDSTIQATTSRALGAWVRADALAATTAAQAPTIDHLGPVFNLLNADAQPALAAQPTADQQASLAELRTQQGAEFDALYVTIARPALGRLEAAEKDYILNGDDETLRALAVHTLPKIERLVAELRRF